MAQGSFSSAVTAWVKETKARQNTVYRESAQRVVEVMQVPKGLGGNLPLDLGFLRASLVGGIGAVAAPVTTPPKERIPVAYDPGPISLLIVGADITDPIEVRYTAIYARVAEYGGPNRAANRFVALAAQQWALIVDQVCAEARNRS